MLREKSRSSNWLEFVSRRIEKPGFICVEADSSFIEYINNLADNHHPLMKSDIVRAYHFGNNFLVIFKYCSLFM